MTAELLALAWSTLLALVYLSTQTFYRKAELGVRYDVGPRDDGRAVTGLHAGRADRAYRNFLETYPVFIALVVVVTLADRSSALTQWGAWVYLGFRTIYLPLYIAGIPWLRTFAWNIATLGLALIMLGVVL